MALRLRPCGCGKMKTTQPLPACRHCLKCDQEMHTQYDIILHHGHRQEPIIPAREVQNGKDARSV